MNSQSPLSLPIICQCQCGQAKFSISKLHLTFYACHCTECQSQSASAFGLLVWVERSAFNYSGNVKTWSRDTASGGRMDCHFCPDCGTRLWHESNSPDPVFGKIVSIKGGSIAAMRKLQPVRHIWTKSKHASTVIPKNVLNFPNDNIDAKALVDAWKHSLLPTKI